MPRKYLIALIVILSCLGIWYYSTRSLLPAINQISTTSAPPLPGHRFVFVNNPRREFTEEESQYIATHYDLAVVGFQSDPMIASAKRIKEINPDIKLFVYFPTSIRQDGARYGQDIFKEEWYLHDSAGNRIKKGQSKSLEYVDLTQDDYIDWARRTVLDFLAQPPFDGAVFDNANPIGVVNNNWLDLISQQKLDDWNESQLRYLRNMTTNFNNRNKILIFNGIHRAKGKVDRTLSHLDITNGALNENFCYGQDNEGDLGVVPKELQLEDIDLQLSIGNRQKYVLQKINWEGELSSLPEEMQVRLGNYCFGIFLMGHVPGYTFFKFGDGYNLNLRPEEYLINAEAINAPLGAPTNNYQNDDWLITRKFTNGYVIVNLDTKPNSWTTPTVLNYYTNGMYTQIQANKSIPMPPQSAKFFIIQPSVNTSPSPSASHNTIAGDFNNDGHVNLADYNLLISGYGTTYNLSHYNQLLSNYGL